MLFKQEYSLAEGVFSNLRVGKHNNKGVEASARGGADAGVGVGAGACGCAMVSERVENINHALCQHWTYHNPRACMCVQLHSRRSV